MTRQKKPRNLQFQNPYTSHNLAMQTYFILTDEILKDKKDQTYPKAYNFEMWVIYLESNFLYHR